MINSIVSCKQVLKTPEIQAHLNSSNKWWSNYIFHFSHVVNVASILNNNKLYSREQLDKFGLSNLNDNASQEVMEGTDDKYKDYVRFYFRPLTPTQYHNEGIRANQEITELNAHCPVPVFLLFDTALLDEKNTEFSYESLASHHYVELYSGKEALALAPFHHIYHNESTYGLDGSLIRKRRHAEIVVKQECDLRYLNKIVCRNDAEARTLKTLLTEEALDLYENMICIVGVDEFDTNNPDTIFRNTYLQILWVSLSSTKCVFHFNKQCNHNRELLIEFLDEDNKQICYVHDKNFTIHKSKTFSVVKLDKYLEDKKVVTVKAFLDNHLVFMNRFKRK
ncbi:DarT ssDNA thymidine ADP-ribosyltransferase family protein [Lysinibacillus sphaericus]|uniref:DarT ssDNA thymidine ADP-ribosyltransferase family protein n=1 Tax=Lysinibacillus sphaericus TaxID=1421 RepID=UPI00056D0DCC|nr:DarT ssDNA thymidine ADP-ribosyltransferase family protein [Lysinibacillus sphaericus]